MSIMVEKGLTKSSGKVYKPLQSVKKTKYLAVSPVTDNFEQLDLELLEDLSHPNFLS